jgi:uncharacterized membrane protein YdfJ with MMPL/SSD domain
MALPTEHGVGAWGLRVVAAATIVAALVGCSTSPTPSNKLETGATPTTPGAHATMDAFRLRLNPVMEEVNKNFQWMDGAAGSVDYADLRAACRAIDGTVDKLEGILPSPDAGITGYLRTATKDWRQMAFTCQGISVETPEDVVASIGDSRKAGLAAFNTAVNLVAAQLKPATGPGQ